jgi:hypothetical protein
MYRSDISSIFVYITDPGGRALYGLGLDRFVTGIVGSNPARGMDVCLCVSVMCCPVYVEAFATG